MPLNRLVFIYIWKPLSFLLVRNLRIHEEGSRKVINWSLLRISCPLRYNHQLKKINKPTNKIFLISLSFIAKECDFCLNSLQNNLISYVYARPIYHCLINFHAISFTTTLLPTTLSAFLLLFSSLLTRMPHSLHGSNKLRRWTIIGYRFCILVVGKKTNLSGSAGTQL